MTPEEMKAAFDAFKAETAGAIAAMTAKSDAAAAEVERLRGANKRLLVDLKKAKVKVRPPAEDDDSDDDDDAEDDAPAGKTDSRVAALEKQLREANERNAEKASRAAISEAMDAAKIAPAFRAAVAALLKVGRKIEVRGDDVLIDGVKASEAVATWAASDEGKVYVAAPASGVPGQSPQSRPVNKAPTLGDMMGKGKKDFSIAAKGAFIRTHGEDAWHALP